MIINNRKVMGSYVSFRKDELKLSCKDPVLIERIEEIIKVAKDNCSNGNGWNELDYVKFFKQFVKLEFDAFNELYDEILNLLNLPLEDVKERLIELDNKLKLHLFEDERTTEPVNKIKTVDGKDIVVKTQKIVFKKHEFSSADIILFFQKLYSEIKKYNNKLINTYQGNIDSYKTLKEKESEVQLLIELLNEKDSDICDIIFKDYFKWFENLTKDDSIYIYLNSKTSYLITQNLMVLKQKLYDYKEQEVTTRYIKEQASNHLNEVLMYNQKTKNYNKCSIYF